MQAGGDAARGTLRTAVELARRDRRHRAAARGRRSRWAASASPPGSSTTSSSRCWRPRLQRPRAGRHAAAGAAARAPRRRAVLPQARSAARNVQPVAADRPRLPRLQGTLAYVLDQGQIATNGPDIRARPGVGAHMRRPTRWVVLTSPPRRVIQQSRPAARGLCTDIAGADMAIEALARTSDSRQPRARAYIPAAPRAAGDDLLRRLELPSTYHLRAWWSLQDSTIILAARSSSGCALGQGRVRESRTRCASSPISGHAGLGAALAGPSAPPGARRRRGASTTVWPSATSRRSRATCGRWRSACSPALGDLPRRRALGAPRRAAMPLDGAQRQHTGIFAGCLVLPGADRAATHICVADARRRCASAWATSHARCDPRRRGAHARPPRTSPATSNGLRLCSAVSIARRRSALRGWMSAWRGPARCCLCRTPRPRRRAGRRSGGRGVARGGHALALDYRGPHAARARRQGHAPPGAARRQPGIEFHAVDIVAAAAPGGRPHRRRGRRRRGGRARGRGAGAVDPKPRPSTARAWRTCARRSRRPRTSTTPSAPPGRARRWSSSPASSRRGRPRRPRPQGRVERRARAGERDARGQGRHPPHRRRGREPRPRARDDGPHRLLLPLRARSAHPVTWQVDGG